MSKRKADRKVSGIAPEVYVFDRAGVRRVDGEAVERFGIPGIVLMENAARHAADVALGLVRDSEKPRVVIVCGSGNNGGDGFAVARHLSNAGIEVVVAMLTPVKELKGDAAINARIVAAMGVEMEALRVGVGGKVARLTRDADLVVDAILGTGLDRSVAGKCLDAIRGINRWRERAEGRGGRSAAVLALDIPSGLDCDTGEPLGDLSRAVRADVTVTFAGLKRGFLSRGAWDFLGEVVVADIGVPRALLEELGTRLGSGGGRASGGGPAGPTRGGDSRRRR